MAHASQRLLRGELMDDPNADRGELDAALRFIRLSNRLFGGVRAALRPLKRWSRAWERDRPIRIIDLGTGSADIPIAIADWARRRGHSVKITAVDRHPTTIELAREHVGDRDDIELVQADALHLMDLYEPGAFDYAHAGMFLHHLEDIEVLTVLRIMERLACHGVIWNDLVRSRLVMAMVATAAIVAPPMARHDARASVAAGFTRREALDLARRVGFHKPRYRRHLLYRFTIDTQPGAQLRTNPERSSGRA